MRAFARLCSLLLVVAFVAGCHDAKPSSTPDVPANVGSTTMTPGSVLGGLSDANKVARVDYSILFVGNSHTAFHNLPGLICDMIRFRHPEQTTYYHYVPVAFLDVVAQIPTCKQELETRPWKYVVFQAQRISMSGQHNYSQQEGIDIARFAHSKGVKTIFYAEWGMKGVPNDGERQDQIYRGMAKQAGATVASVAKAWDLALSKRPDLPLYQPDGNHQSSMGAFLTACVLYGSITGESPHLLSAYPYQPVSETDRQYLANVAAKVVADEKASAP